MVYSPLYSAAPFCLSSSVSVPSLNIPYYQTEATWNLGIKPLSIYGLIHFCRPGRGSLVDANYVLSPEERDRIVGILREHLLDVDGIEGDEASSPHYNAISILPLSDRSHRDIGTQA